MKITYPQVEQILKTLPISYYIHQNVEVTLSATNDTSYYDIMNNKIVVSFKQLLDASDKLTDEHTLEEDIRCLLYHETSHAFLTPKKLENTNIVNIFEDERIETILHDYYLKVDFKSFVKKINDWHYQTPQSALEFFYQIVRFRYGPEYFTRKVNDIIDTHKELVSYSDDYYRDITCYKRDIEDLYAMIEAYFNRHFKHDTSTNQSTLTADNMTVVNNTGDMKPDAFAKADIKENTTMLNFNIHAKQLINSIVTKYQSDNILQEINYILNSQKSLTQHNSSAINAYSGKFDPRSVIRQDYKYFIQQNRVGHVKEFSKLHLNLFIDCSGSFRSSDLTINKILYALTYLEKSNPNFEFDLISCGMSEVVRDKSDRIQQSDGGNDLDKHIFPIFKKQQHVDKQNINIVCFDGDAYSDTHSDRDINSTFKAFDTANTIIISDYSNGKYFRHQHLTQAKIILTNKYTVELYKNIITALKCLCH